MTCSGQIVIGLSCAGTRYRLNDPVPEFPTENETLLAGTSSGAQCLNVSFVSTSPQGQNTVLSFARISKTQDNILNDPVPEFST